MHVSIVITNHNYGDLVGRAIDSVLSQTYPANIVVIDNGSQDDSWDVIQQYEADIFKVEIPLGAAGAKNLGLRVIEDHYDIVGFLDADDELVPNAIERIVGHFDGRVGLVYADYINSNNIHSYNHRVYCQSFSIDSLAHSSHINHTIFVSHKAVERVGLFDDGLAVNDVYDYVWRVSEAFPVIHVPEVLSRNNLTTRSLRHQVDQWELSKQLVFQKAKNRAKHNNTGSRGGLKT